MFRPSRPPLSRRAVIRGAGSIAIALPWLEIMERKARAAAPAGPARRFVGVFQPGGTVRPKYTPTGTETAFTVGPILRPLTPMQDRLLVLDGLDMKSAVGEQHQSGIVALLTGTPQKNGGSGYAAGPSIDQVIATRISAGKKPRASIQLAVRWATGRSKGRLHPINVLSFEDNATFNPIPPRLDPQQIFSDLFGTAMPGQGGDPAAEGRLTRKRSILDHVGKRYQTLAARLGMADRQKLEQHLSKLRELERTLGTPGMGPMPMPPGACQAPERVDTSDYNPRSGLNSDDTGSIVDTRTDEAIPKVGKFLTDMLVTALACDLTAVATLQWCDTEAKHTLPWLGLKDHHHYYQHDGGFRPAECERICTWYSEQHLYLLQQMQAVDMGGHSLLDESVVFLGNELQDPPAHGKTNMPFVLAGGGGGLRTGRWLKYGGRSHNDLLVSIVNLFGDNRQSFGDPEYFDRPIDNLV
jgi:Protein of unknown function (DUF1552)